MLYNVFERNTALEYGGNLYADCGGCDDSAATSYINIDNNTFTFGSAPLAGGVYVYGTTDGNGNGLADGIAFWNNILTC